MTYFDAIGIWQQRSADALKVAQSTQVASLQVALECASAFNIRSSPARFVAGPVSDITKLIANFSFALLEQQVSYAKQIADAMAPARATHVDTAALAIAAEAPLALPAPLETPDVVVESATSSALAAVETAAAQSTALPVLETLDVVVVENATSSALEVAEAAVAQPAAPPVLDTADVVVESAASSALAVAETAAPQLAAPPMIETSHVTVPVVSGEFSTTAAGPDDPASAPKAKKLPASSGRAKAKPPKAPSVSSDFPTKQRGPQPD